MGSWAEVGIGTVGNKVCMGADMVGALLLSMEEVGSAQAAGWAVEATPGAVGNGVHSLGRAASATAAVAAGSEAMETEDCICMEEGGDCSIAEGWALS